MLNKGKIKTFVTVTEKTLDIKLADNIAGNDVFNELGLKNLRRCIHKSDKTQFFFLSDYEHKNVEAVYALKKLITGYDRDISAIYCHARENRINRSIFDNFGAENKIYLIDSSMLAVQQIKNSSDSQPVNFVEYDNVTGTVSSVFTSMIIGFGETGRDVFRFLYEFSSFVKKTRKDDDGKDDIIEQDKNFILSTSILMNLKRNLLSMPLHLGIKILFNGWKTCQLKTCSFGAR